MLCLLEAWEGACLLSWPAGSRRAQPWSLLQSIDAGRGRRPTPAMPPFLLSCTPAVLHARCTPCHPRLMQIWDAFMDSIEPFARRIPYMVGTGNHEYDYQREWAQPGAVLHCAVLCCTALCCAALCCAVLLQASKPASCSALPLAPAPPFVLVTQASFQSERYM